jgi:NHLM bacteriocin system ABC transporter ATP-binding protein
VLNDVLDAGGLGALGVIHRLRGGGGTVLVELSGHAGTRHPLGRLQAGEAAFSLAQPALRLVLLPDPGAEVEALAPDSLPPGLLAQLATIWLRLIHSARGKPIPETPATVPSLIMENAAFAAELLDGLTRTQRGAVRHADLAAAADDAGLAAALAQLTPGRADPAATAAATGQSPMVAVLRAAAAANGASLPPDFARLPAVSNDAAALPRLVAQAGMRLRMTRLQPAWWRASGETMIAGLADGTPVALIPLARRWRMVRPNGSAVIVNAAIAAAIQPHAHVLYRGFDDRQEKPGRALLHFVLSIVRRDMLGIGLTSLLVSLLGLATPFLTGMLVQSVIPVGVRGEVAQVVLALLAVSMGAIGFELARGLAVLRVESLLGSAVEAALWDRLLRLSPSFFQRFGAGDLALRADAVNRMRREIGFATITALIGALFSCVQFVFLLRYGWQPAVLTLLVCVVEIILLSAVTWFELSIQRRALANGGALQTLTVQIFQGIAKLRSAAAESRFLARWIGLFAIDQTLHFRGSLAGGAVAAFGAGWTILVMAALIALVGFGATTMSLGDYVTYSGLSGQFVSATLSLAGLVPAMARVLPLWERARPILTEPKEDAGGRVQPGPLRGEIELAHVGFNYPGGPPILRDISLTVPAGAFVALVGPSGSGKSTLLRLLLGFEQPGSGTILLDGHDLRDLDIGAVRRQLGVVLQNSRIESGTLYQNIAGASALSLQDVQDAARQAGLEADIAAMPMGLHTLVDDSGATISGGQRQRLLLARAIARQPRMMLLDEATSALDAATQDHVMQTLAALHITRVVVAHRLSTVRHADWICVMSEGRLVEQGDYDTLVAAGGLFSSLIRRQLA